MRLRCLAYWLTIISFFIVILVPIASGQMIHDGSSAALQPLAQQVRQIENALNYLGQPLADVDIQRINAAISLQDESAAVAELEKILEHYVLVVVEINAESRVMVLPGPAKPELVEKGTRIFLVKVINDAGVTAPLEVHSENSGPVYGELETANKGLTAQNAIQRWTDISMYDQNPLRERLSGLPLEYRILEIYSRDSGQRSAKLSFSAGQGTQDIGFRNETTILFKALPASRLQLYVHDEKDVPTIASFTIKDSLGRIYPNPSKRLAPDLFFQPQVYRASGSYLELAAGTYSVKSSLGPEYLSQTKNVTVHDGSSAEVSFKMERWIDPSKYGWYSGDHHIHAAGCSHYQNPTQGVRPEDMALQVQGEKLNVASVLTWQPGYDYQKQFFSGHDDPHSKSDSLLHYDLEVSGFPSSHAGHLVLLGLTEQNYPNTKGIADWPTWDLPVLRWAKAQGATTGFAHSALGLKVKTTDLPNYEVPSFDGVGANEYIVDVTYPGTVDFISTMDTPYVPELNLWYHALNVGFRTRISGETDFPCITDTRVGQGRVYAKVDGQLTYSKWLDSLRAGRSYVSDGRSHLMNFSVNGIEVGTSNSEVHVDVSTTVKIALKVAAYLDPVPDEMIRALPSDVHPYWTIERARIGNTRNVAVEIVVDGKPVAHEAFVADGQTRDLHFEIPIQQTSWVAARILPSSHTNPIFIIVGGKPMRPLRASAEWCLAGVNQCWTQKAPLISPRELPEARQAYDHAREVYRQLILESEGADAIFGDQGTRETSPNPRLENAGAVVVSSATKANDKTKEELHPIRSGRSNEAAPVFHLNDLNGKPFSLADARGKAVLLVFWATWCGPCRSEVPYLIDLQKHYMHKLEIIAIAAQEKNVEEVQQFVRRSGINYRVAMASDDLVEKYGGIAILPTAFLINRQGRVVQKYVGVDAPNIYEIGLGHMCSKRK